MQRGKYLFSRNISHHNMTIGQLKHALSQHTGAWLASNIVRCLKTVKATRPYWNMEGGKLWDMIEQIGTPTLSYTLSMADMSWPDLHKLMPDDPFAPGLTPGQSLQIRFHNVVSNPHIVANYLSTKHQLLLDTVLQHLDIQDNARVSDFWY
jgi:Helitron helicase-like domain at N-terminus